MSHPQDQPVPLSPQPYRQLFVDLDGVLADFDAFYFSTFGVRLDRNSPGDPPGMWDNIESHGDFYGVLPLMSDALALWEGAKRIHPNPILLSGVPHSIRGAAEQKRRWVDQHLGKDVPLILCKSRDKARYGRPGDVLIDDWHRYRDLWERMGGTFVLHTSVVDSLSKTVALFEPLSPSVNEEPKPMTDPIPSPLDLEAIERVAEGIRKDAEDDIEDFATLYNALTALLAYARRLEQAQAWQPIATAPKDGTRILAVWHDGTVRIVRWFMWSEGHGFKAGACWKPEQGGTVPINFAPTIWQPLRRADEHF
jgi:hypothetical protein